jgi:plasmid stabilization system protein ParE
MPSVNLDFHPEALAETQSSFLWYSERSAAAGDSFMAELDHAIAQIAERPETWPQYLHGTHRYLLRRYPFLVVYRFKAEDVQVIAVAHASRRPGYWKDR